MTVVSSTQLTLDFEPGLTERYPTLLDCVRGVAHSHKNPLKTIAFDMDISLSELSRKLSANSNDPRHFSVEDLERFMVATDDLTPIYWQIEKFLQDEQSKQQRAAHELMKRLPDMIALLQAAQGGAKAA